MSSARACPIVASSACWARSCRIVVVADDCGPPSPLESRGSWTGGRRYIDAPVSGAPQVRTSTRSMMNSAFAGTSMPIRSARERSRLKRFAVCSACRRPRPRSSIRRSPEDGTMPPDATKRRRTSSRDRPALVAVAGGRRGRSFRDPKNDRKIERAICGVGPS